MAALPDRQRNPGHDVTPTPDPTILTRNQITQEVANLRDIIFARLDAMDRAILVFNENFTRVPTDTDKQIGHLRELLVEKISKLETQFSDRDVSVNKAFETQGQLMDTLRMLYDTKISDLYELKRHDFVALTETVRVLKETIGTQFIESKDAVAFALTAAERAVSKAEVSTEKRFESVNEFRAQLTSQAAGFVVRSEYDRAHKDMVDKIEGANTNLDVKIDTIGSAATESRATLATTLNDKIDLISKTINDKIDTRVSDMSLKIDDLRSSALKSEGRGGGLAAGWGYLVGGIGLLAAIIAIVFNVIKFTSSDATGQAVAAAMEAARISELNKRIDALANKLNENTRNLPAQKP